MRFRLARGVDGFQVDALDFVAHDPLLRSNPAAPLRGAFGHAEARALVEATAAPEGSPCWSFSNHDVARVATRWAPGGQADPRVTKLLLTLRGSACLCQGEELGLPEAELPFAALRFARAMLRARRAGFGRGRDRAARPAGAAAGLRQGGVGDAGALRPQPVSRCGRRAAGPGRGHAAPFPGAGAWAAGDARALGASGWLGWAWAGRVDGPGRGAFQACRIFHPERHR